MKGRCRVCLADDRNTYSVANTALEQTYNVISSVKLQRAGRPTALCCVCVSQLRRCRRFIDTARESNAALDRWNQDHTYTNFKLSEQPLVMLTKNQLFQIICDGALELEVNQEVVEPDDARINEDNELTFLTEEIEYEVTLDYDQSDPALISYDEKDIIQPTDVKNDIAEMSENEDYTQFSRIKMEDSVKNECPLTDGSELKKWRPITVGDQLSDLDTGSTPKVKRKIFSCSQCNYQTAVKTDFKRHSTKHTGEKPFACDQCDYKCTRKRSLKRHFLSHTGEKPYACEKCDYRGISRVHLKRHFMIHTGEKPFMCNKCDYKCNKMNNLKTHLLTHTSEKPYVCDLCDFKCKQKSNLKMHLLTHTGEKAFACDKCNYKCSRKGALQKHLMIHTGEKPFSCDKCDYKSNVKEQIKRHSMIHTGEKPFACDQCDYRTNLRSSLRRHSIIHS